MQLTFRLVRVTLVHLRVALDVLLREVYAVQGFAHLDGVAIIPKVEVFALQRPVVSRRWVVDAYKLVM